MARLPIVPPWHADLDARRASTAAEIAHLRDGAQCLVVGPHAGGGALYALAVAHAVPEVELLAFRDALWREAGRAAQAGAVATMVSEGARRGQHGRALDTQRLPRPMQGLGDAVAAAVSDSNLRDAVLTGLDPFALGAPIALYATAEHAIAALAAGDPRLAEGRAAALASGALLPDPADAELRQRLAAGPKRRRGRPGPLPWADMFQLWRLEHARDRRPLVIDYLRRAAPPARTIGGAGDYSIAAHYVLAAMLGETAQAIGKFMEGKRGRRAIPRQYFEPKPKGRRPR